MALESRREELEKNRGIYAPSFYSALAAMAYRQVARFIAARSRMVNSLAMPIVWLVFFGLGWSSAFSTLRGAERILFGGLSYLEYLAPGIIVMTVFMAGFGSGLSVLWDREFGYLKEVLVSPAPRQALILGRIIGDSLASLVQGVVMALLVSLIAGWPGTTRVLAVLVAAYTAALASTSIGTFIALNMQSPEGFHLALSLITMPLLFTSSTYYPVDPLPAWLKALAYMNPLYYAVDLARGLMYGVHYTPLLLDALGLLAVSTLFTLLAIVKFTRTYIA